jgi:hypothetical protein
MRRDNDLQKKMDYDCSSRKCDKEKDIMNHPMW